MIPIAILAATAEETWVPGLIAAIGDSIVLGTNANGLSAGQRFMDQAVASITSQLGAALTLDSSLNAGVDQHLPANALNRPVSA